MAYPKKKRGFREITVNGVTYRWRVSYAQYSGLANPIAIGISVLGPKSSKQPLSYSLHSSFTVIYQYKNGRFLITDFVPNPDAPASITPRFVRQAILYGLEHGWTPDKRADALSFEWNKNMFDEDSPHPPAPSPPGGEGE